MEKRKSWFPSLIVIIILSVLILFFAYNYVNKLASDAKAYDTIGRDFNSKENEPNNIQTETNQQATTTWHEIIKFQGEGIKDTETFHIPSNEWKISYNTRPGKYGEQVFAIYIYNSDGKMFGLIGNVIGERNDSSILRGSGDYYLSINSGQPYTIVVEAKY